MDLQELIKFRTEVGRELTHAEVDTNFKKVANPYNSERDYYSQDIVYIVNSSTNPPTLELYMYYNPNNMVPAPITAPNLYLYGIQGTTDGWIGVGNSLQGTGGGGIAVQGVQGTDGIQGVQGIQGLKGGSGAQGERGLVDAGARNVREL